MVELYSLFFMWEKAADGAGGSRVCGGVQWGSDVAKTRT